MKIEVTEEIKKELRHFAAYEAWAAALYADPKTRDGRRQHIADRDLKATGCRIARLVAEAVEREETT